MSVHSHARPLTAATLVSKMEHGLLHSGVNVRGRYDQFDTDYLLVANSGEHHEPMVPVSEVVDVSGSRNEKLRHNGRFDNAMLHDFPRLGLVVALAQNTENHCSKSYTRNGSANSFVGAQFSLGSGKCAVNTSLALSNLGAVS